VKSKISEEWKSGLTPRVALSILYAAIVLMPVTIWGELAVGPVRGLTWTAVILFFWIASLYGKPLTRQELYVMFAAVSTVAYAAGPISFTGLIYNAWFAGSPIAKLYGIESFLPYWFAPSDPLIRQQMIRTFIHPQWFYPIFFSVIFWIMNLIIGLSLGTFLYQLFVVTEKLPFPMARVDAEVVTQLEARDPAKMRILMSGAIFGFIYSLIAYGTPMISEAILKFRAVIIPFPWVDLTRAFEDILPGAMIGIDTSPFNYMMGFIIPFQVAAYMFIGSIATSVIGNYLIVRYFPHLIPEWTNFPVGMTLRDLLFWSGTYVWYSVGIGVAFSVFVAQLIGGRRGLARTIKALLRPSATMKAVGTLSLWKILAIYLSLTSIWLIIVSKVMIPGFPILPLAFLIIVWPFVFGIVTTRAYAETGYFLNIPYLQNNILIASMISANIPVRSKLGIYPWFTPLGVANGSGWCSTFYVCDRIKLTFKSYIKAVVLIATPLSVLFSFLYTQMLWSITPIPSSMFPYAQIYWPLQAAQHSLWYTRRIYGLNPQLIYYSFAVGTALWAVTRAVHIPFSLIGLAMGVSSPLPTPLATFIGALIFRALQRRFGDPNRIRSYAYMFTGGIGVGFAAAVAISVSIVMISKSTWILPY